MQNPWILNRNFMNIKRMNEGGFMYPSHQGCYSAPSISTIYLQFESAVLSGSWESGTGMNSGLGDDEYVELD